MVMMCYDLELDLTCTEKSWLEASLA